MGRPLSGVCRPAADEVVANEPGPGPRLKQLHTDSEAGGTGARYANSLPHSQLPPLTGQNNVTSSTLSTYSADVH